MWRLRTHTVGLRWYAVALPSFAITVGATVKAYPLTVDQITSWFRAKQTELAGSPISLVEVRARTEFVPAATADFDGINSMGTITAWVSGEFDFEVLRVSDGKNVFMHHAKVEAIGQLEPEYLNFIRALEGRSLISG